MQMRRGKRLFAGAMALCVAAASVMTGGMPVTVRAQETSEQDQEWEKVAGILDSYAGIYTEDTGLGSPWNTTFSPDGPLMGNGTVYAFMAGDQKSQNLYLSHSNMWQDRSSDNGQEYTTFGGITIQLAETADGVNLALDKEVSASSFVSGGEAPEYMVDGKSNTKWCSTLASNNNSSTYWAVVDLGEVCDISRWVVKHAQAGGETSEFNSVDFKLQYLVPDGIQNAAGTGFSGKTVSEGSASAGNVSMSIEGVSRPGPDVTGGDISDQGDIYRAGRSAEAKPAEEDWVEADSVSGNKDAVTDRNLELPIRARYVRLLVTKPTQSSNNAVRIYELELYEEPKLHFGDMQPFGYKQDMKNAEVTGQSTQGFTTVSWLSAKENILVTDITNVTESDLPMEVSNWTANANTTAEVDGDVMIASKAGISKPKDRDSGTGKWEGWKVNVTMASRVIGEVDVTASNVSGSKNTASFVLKPGQTVTMVSAVEGGKEGDGKNSPDQAVEKAVTKLFTRSSQDELDKSRQLHREYWKDYWMKSYIDIQDADVERMYYGMLYQLGCSTSVSSENNGGVAAGLFPWTAADHPAWQGDYTTNTDFQRQIHPLVNANRTSGIQNYINIIKQYWPEAQRRSASVTDLNWVIEGTPRPEKFKAGIDGGALFPTHIGPWGASTEQYNGRSDYWNSPADATSVLMPVIKMWKYTLDESLLEELYPMMKAVSIFWENYVTLENGKYVVYGATHENVPGRNPVFDVDACKYMLNNTILAAKELEADVDKVEIWQNIVDNMSSVPTFTYNGKETICDVEGRTQSNTGHTFDGNPVTIQSVYYYDSIGMSDSVSDKEKYINYLDVKNGMGSHRRLISATRLGYDIVEIMDQLKIGSINKAPSDWEGIRGNNTIGDIGGTGRLAIVQDSLLQSNEGFINIFANWYDDQSASFRRLRAENAFLVDADQNGFGQVTYALIHSEKGRECSVLNPWPGQEMDVYENGILMENITEVQNLLGTVYTFATGKGKDYELKPSGRLEDIFYLNEEKLEIKAGITRKLSVATNIKDAQMSWTSSDPEIVVVGKDGSVLSLKEGAAVITVSVLGTDLTATCEVTVLPAGGAENVAPYGTATSNSHHENFTADRAVNGEWQPSYEGWASANESWENVNSRWMQIDLGQEYTIDRWVLKHDGHRSQNTEDPVGDPDDASNWGDYYLQISPDGEDGWQTVDSKTDNKNNTTDKTLETPVTGRYFRIYMEFPMFKQETGWPWPNGFARLNQVELYAVAEDPEAIEVQEIQKFDPITVLPGTSFEELQLPGMAEAVLSNGMTVEFPVSWDSSNYDPEQPGICSLTGALTLPHGIGNPSGLGGAVKVRLQETNKEDLNALIEYAVTRKESANYKYVVQKVKKAFEAALDSAAAVAGDPKATEDQVRTAYEILQKAIMELKEYPDKTRLEAMLASSGEIDISLYTEASAAVFTRAISRAKAVMDNPEAAQKEVDEAEEQLDLAVQQLERKPDSGDDQEDPGQGDDDQKDDGQDDKVPSGGSPADGTAADGGSGDTIVSPQTGDHAQTGIMAAALIAGLGISAAALRKKKM